MPTDSWYEQIKPIDDTPWAEVSLAVDLTSWSEVALVIDPTPWEELVNNTGPTIEYFGYGYGPYGQTGYGE